MSPEWVSILALIALFVVGTVLPINMGALGFVAAWLVGMYSPRSAWSAAGWPSSRG